MWIKIGIMPVASSFAVYVPVAGRNRREFAKNELYDFAMFLTTT